MHYHFMRELIKIENFRFGENSPLFSAKRKQSFACGDYHSAKQIIIRRRRSVF
jgi:hypothetical protein